MILWIWEHEYDVSLKRRLVIVPVKDIFAYQIFQI